MVLPVVYQNIKEKSHGIIPKISSSKFLGIYSVAVFIWYIVCFSLSSTTMPVKEMNVTYRENTSFTSAEMLDIQINQQNIENISINGESINIEWETFTYSFPLTMGSNSINIVWTSWSFEEKFTKNIERISAEQVEARKEEERQKAELVKQEQEEKRVNDAKERLNRELEWVRNFDGSGFRWSTESIIIESAMFWGYGWVVDEFINDPNSEVKNLATQLKSEVSALQIKEYPRMRKAYIDILDEKLWTSNIDVIAKWSDNWTIEFVGAIFANNQNKKDTADAYIEVLKSLRFDQINFKWYEYDDITYFKIESLWDSEVVKISE